MNTNINFWRRTATLALAATLTLVAGCKREERAFHVSAPSADPLISVRLSTLQPGKHQTITPIENDYEGNAQALSDGKRLFEQFNCSGCHSHGGGGMGPALMDDQWIYGSNPEQVYSTIIQGRPNGMPSFGGKIPSYQVWQLAAYVRSMSGLASGQASPGRSDHMQGKPPENSIPTQPPLQSSHPQSADMPK
jgi:cytochrome c oxidase cbb3-type subunit 3